MCAIRLTEVSRIRIFSAIASGDIEVSTPAIVRNCDPARRWDWEIAEVGEELCQSRYTSIRRGRRQRRAGVIMQRGVAVRLPDRGIPSVLITTSRIVCSGLP